jgi:hypothetical protein
MDNSEAYISYLDDNDKVVSGFVVILSMEGCLVTFQTQGGNRITINQNRVKSLIEEYIAIIHNKADNDPYFMERVGYNTIKHLNELDDISKEA